MSGYFRLSLIDILLTGWEWARCLTCSIKFDISLTISWLWTHIWATSNFLLICWWCECCGLMTNTLLVSIILCMLLKRMFDNSNLDVTAGRVTLIWACFYFNYLIFVKSSNISLYFVVIDCNIKKTSAFLFYSWFHLFLLSIFILFPWTWSYSIFNLFRDFGNWQLF